MKIKAMALASVLACFASVPAMAADACEVTLCMYGELTGEGGGSACSEAISEFFGIQVRKKGKFRPGPTSDKRKSFLAQCPHDHDEQDMIIKKFGRVLRG